ncbi:uncharacterized protein [Watersipora subatra]|uniref:uncharacterized protein n=1 Tax=Watersipora subatra TaxID=2589382 RepID=UPI00355C7BC2
MKCQCGAINAINATKCSACPIIFRDLKAQTRMSTLKKRREEGWAGKKTTKYYVDALERAAAHAHGAGLSVLCLVFKPSGKGTLSTIIEEGCHQTEIVSVIKEAFNDMTRCKDYVQRTYKPYNPTSASTSATTSASTFATSTSAPILTSTSAPTLPSTSVPILPATPAPTLPSTSAPTLTSTSAPISSAPTLPFTSAPRSATTTTSSTTPTPTKAAAKTLVILFFPSLTTLLARRGNTTPAEYINPNNSDSDAEEIFSEKLDKNGRTLYLVKWKHYSSQ